MKRIESLDALRAVAALSVFFYHVKQVADARLGNFMWFGWVGVELFFVLSGFFIGVAVFNPQEWKPLLFLQRRLRRIVPAFYVSLFISVTLINSWFLVHRTGWEIIFKHLLMVHNVFSNSFGTINGAYWTLGVEAYFYVLMMITAPLLRSRWRWALLAIWLVICYIWRAWVVWYAAPDPTYRFFVATQLPGMLDLFGIGVVLAWVATKRDWFQRASAHYQWLAPLLLLVGGGIFAFCVQLVSLYAATFWFDSFAVIGWRTLLGLSFAAMIVALILLDNSLLFRRLLNITGIAYIGRISYSIYLYHLPVILSLQRAEVPGFPTDNLKMAVMMTIITIVVAMMSYHLVEAPFYRSKST
jgi:peptidoglycan/LPS O-acetylase OafA/YrhL